MATTTTAPPQADEGSKGTKGRQRRIRPGQSKEQSVLATRLVAVEGEIDATERRVARLEKSWPPQSSTPTANAPARSSPNTAN